MDGETELLGLCEALGLIDALGDCEGDVDLDRLALGVDDTDALGLTEADGETDADGLLLDEGEVEEIAVSGSNDHDALEELPTFTYRLRPSLSKSLKNAPFLNPE